MAYTTINKSTDYFNTKTWTGTGSSNALTGIGHQSDFVWIKQRGGTTDHHLYDVVRGTTKALASNSSDAEATKSTGLTAFGSDGFTLGADSGVNGSSNTYVGWSWKAGGGQGSSNTDGSINTIYTSVNTTAGFSISTYTGNQTSGASVGHGLGVAPKMILVKNFTTSDAHAWRVYHKSIGATKELYLNLNNVPYTATNIWNDQEPTSSVFYLGNNDSGTNKSGVNYVAYCFAEKTGYSKFGSYVGNASTDGAFVYTGFKPAFFLYKETSQSGQNWTILDNKREPTNLMGKILHPDLSNAESDQTGGTAINIDFLSNGIKIRGTDANINRSGSTYIYMAFAEAPLVGSNNIPCTAR